MTEKRFEVTNISTNGMTALFKLGNDTLSVYDVARLVNELLEENEQLKSELKGMEQLLKSYRKTIEHDAELLADATNNGYLPPLEDWKGDIK